MEVDGAIVYPERGGAKPSSPTTAFPGPQHMPRSYIGKSLTVASSL